MFPDRRTEGARVALGLALIIVGGLFALRHAGVEGLDEVWRFWPLALVAAGVVRGLQAPAGQGWRAGFVLAGLGAVLLLHTLGFVRLRLSILWPLVLVFIGLGMLRPPRTRAAARAGGADLSAHAFLGGVERRIVARDFRGGEAVAVLGACEVDLREASLAGGEAAIRAQAFCGGVKIMAPRGWEVDCRGVALLGAFADRRGAGSGSGSADASVSEAAGPRPRLVVTGFALLGGVEVHSG